MELIFVSYVCIGDWQKVDHKANFKHIFHVGEESTLELV